jgi:hypothetical protein
MTFDNSGKDEETSSIRLELVASSEADSVASVSDLMSSSTLLKMRKYDIKSETVASDKARFVSSLSDLMMFTGVISSRGTGQTVPLQVQIWPAKLVHDPCSGPWARASQTAGRVPTVSRSVLFVYSLHMLRLVVELKLSRHIHPIRFASFHYHHDCKVDPQFEISDDGLNVTLMRDLYIRIASKNP